VGEHTPLQMHGNNRAGMCFCMINDIIGILNPNRNIY